HRLRQQPGAREKPGARGPAPVSPPGLVPPPNREAANPLLGAQGYRHYGPAIENSFQVIHQLRRACITPEGLLFQTFQTDGLHAEWYVRLQPRGRYRLIVKHLIDRLLPGFGLERWPAGEQFVEDRPQSIDVRRRADLADSS